MANKVKIKMLTGIAGNHLNEKGEVRGLFAYIPGTEIDWDAVEAKRMVEAGYAQYVTTAERK